VILYGIAAVMGVGGAMLGYSKDLTMLAILAVALVVEGINLLIRRSGPSDRENPD
jgi:multisubunit Na+/H+ antiporter MnhC subunit